MEIAEELFDMHKRSQKNIEDMKRQIAELEKEVELEIAEGSHVL
jgi:hypothetical protein